MPVILMKHKFLLMIIFALLLLSIICQITADVIFLKMIKETDNMATTENKLLKQCKLKYANCYKLNGKITNTAVFVDKFMQRMQYAHLSLNKMPHLAGQLMMMSVLVTGIAVCKCLALGATLFQIIPYYLISILGLYFYFSVSGIVDIQGKKMILKTNLTDYLENHLLPKLEQEQAAEWAAEEKKEGQAMVSAKSGDSLEEQEIKASFGYQEELEDLLKELLA